MNKIQEAVERLNKMKDGNDNEQIHIDADIIILQFVPAEVVKAYIELKENIGFWYS